MAIIHIPLSKRSAVVKRRVLWNKIPLADFKAKNHAFKLLHLKLCLSHWVPTHHHFEG